MNTELAKFAQNFLLNTGKLNVILLRRESVSSLTSIMPLKQGYRSCDA